VKSSASSLDVSGLDTTAFGPRDIAWWGTVGFIVIEGMTLLICAASYFYLSNYVEAWPPLRTPRPAMGPAVIQSILMLLSWYPMARLDHAARRFDTDRVRRLSVVVALFGVALVAVRWFELGALNVRWDANAYGSVTWMTLGFHTTLLVLEVIETICFAVLFFTPRVTERHFSDASDNALYWYFMTSSWILLALMLYLFPRLV
jgi:cytochrome c oxidase subunit III